MSLLSLLAMSLTIKRKRLLVQTYWVAHVSVCLSVCLEGVLWQHGRLNLDSGCHL